MKEITMRRIATGLLTLVLAAPLTGCTEEPPAPGDTVGGDEECVPVRPCGGDDTQYPEYGWSEIHVKLSDGRTVTCIAYRPGETTISCDWTAR